MYTNDEIIVLDHFFTRHDGFVYCAKDSIPTELWSYLVGGFSRSHLALRDRFLAIYKDMHGDGGYDLAMNDMARAITNYNNADNFLVPAIAKATRFMDTWAVGYGHASLKDSSVDRIVVDRVSILVAKLLEETSLGAFQEKSTRYMDFMNAGFILPEYDAEMLGASGIGHGFFDDLHAESMSAYSKVYNAAFNHYYSQLDPSEFKSAKAMENTAKAKAFDVARYCLQPNVPTALGFTIPTRETERHLSALLAHPNSEVRGIAELMLAEATKINPGLLTHVTPNAYRNGYEKILDSKYDPLFAGLDVSLDRHRNECLANVTHVSDLISVETPSFLDLYASIAASIVKRTDATNVAWLVLRQHFADMILEGKGQLVVDLIADRLADRGKHDELPLDFAVGRFCIDIDMDFGAYRDLQRHRVGTQFRSAIDPTYTHVPYLLQDANTPELIAAYNAYIDLSQYVARKHEQLRKLDPVLAEYICILGNNVAFTYMCDFRQLVYMCELRSTPQGHESYRSVVQAIWSVFDNEAQKYPRLYSMFRVNMDKNTDRRAQENRAEEKRAALAHLQD